MLADPNVDVVYVSTRNDMHKEQVLASAAAGKHVLCEKPLALSLVDAVEMRDACVRAGVVMGTNHHLRNAATFRSMQQLVKAGAIGTSLAARVFHAVSLPPALQTWRVHDPAVGAGCRKGRWARPLTWGSCWRNRRGVCDGCGPRG